MEILAGSFTATPVRIVIMRGRAMFVDGRNMCCWSDPTGRIMAPSRAAAQIILRAHGYRLNDDDSVEKEGGPQAAGPGDANDSENHRPARKGRR